MLPSSIRASVSPETITRVGRLFNNTLPDVVRELLQNARRAGASEVRIALSREDGVRLTISDDGIGIADPASVLTLGESRWDGDIGRSEDPAGMGMFSMAGHAVTIVSRHVASTTAWTAKVSAEAWDGSCEIAVLPAARAPGTTIVIDLPGAWDDHVDRVVAAAALHYPLPVFFGGEECPREAWLDKAVHVAVWNGCTIGVFVGANRFQGNALNFHGVTVPSRLPTLAEIQNGASFYAKVDIHDCPAVKLVLPARKEVVENAAMLGLREAAERALFEAVAARPCHHLGFKAWTRARELGVQLPEAEPLLQGWTPARADTQGCEGSSLIPATEVIRVAADEPEVAQCVAAALAKSPLRGQMVCEEPGFDGYAWYDRLARIGSFRFEVEHDGGSFIVAEAASEPPLTAHLEANRIVFKADLLDAGKLYPIAAEAEVVFATNPDCWSGLDAASIVYCPSLAVDELAELLEAAFFSACDDSNSDSWETQHRYFCKEARELALKLLAGPDAAICDRFRALLQENRWLLPAGAELAIAMRGEAITVSLERPAEAVS